MRNPRIRVSINGKHDRELYEKVRETGGRQLRFVLLVGLFSGIFLSTIVSFAGLGWDGLLAITFVAAALLVNQHLRVKESKEEAERIVESI